jgi:hypothetical protein
MQLSIIEFCIIEGGLHLTIQMSLIALILNIRSGLRNSHRSLPVGFFLNYGRNSLAVLMKQVSDRSYRNPSRIFTLSVLLGTLEMSLIV